MIESLAREGIRGMTTSSVQGVGMQGGECQVILLCRMLLYLLNPLVVLGGSSCNP